MWATDARQLVRGEESGEFNKLNAIMGEEITETGDFIVNEKDKVVNLIDSHIVTQVIKAQLIVGHISNVAAISLLSLLAGHTVPQ